MAMPKEWTEAHELGFHAGYNHANYAINVEGRDVARIGVDTESKRVQGSPHQTEGTALDGHLSGVQEGIESFLNEEETAC